MNQPGNMHKKIKHNIFQVFTSFQKLLKEKAILICNCSNKGYYTEKGPL